MSDLESIRDRIAHLRLVRREGPEPSGPSCPTCGDTGWKPVTVDGIQRVGRCDCWLEKQGRWAEGVPLEFHDATLENYRQLPGNEQALQGARDFLAADAGDLFIGGPVGSGKTRLACSVLNDFWRHRPAGYFVHVARALCELQPKDAEEPPSKMEWRLHTSPLLVLDDLGAERERATDFTRRTLLMIYESRSDKRLRTIWTSNKRLGELADMQDDTRLVSRIAGRATAVWIDVADQRLAKEA